MILHSHVLKQILKEYYRFCHQYSLHHITKLLLILHDYYNMLSSVEYLAYLA